MDNDNLKTLLRMCMAGPAERKALAEKLPSKMRAVQDGKVYEIDNVREFILSSDLEGSGLVQYEIYNTVLKGAIQAKCVRDVFPVFKMNTDTMRIPYGDGEITPPIVKEGSEFPAMYQDYNYKTLVAEKRGWHVPITQELIDDGKFDIVAIELEKVGRNLEAQLNEMVISDVIDNHTTEVDTSGSNQGITAIIKAKAKVVSNGFYPDAVIMHPDAWGITFLDFKPAYNATAEDTLRSGVMPMIAGLKAFICGVASNGTQTWAYSSDGNIGMAVVDAKNAGVIGIRDDITVKMHEQPLKMLQSPIIHARWDFVTLHAAAGCRIEY